MKKIKTILLGLLLINSALAEECQKDSTSLVKDIEAKIKPSLAAVCGLGKTPNADGWIDLDILSQNKTLLAIEYCMESNDMGSGVLYRTAKLIQKQISADQQFGKCKLSDLKFFKKGSDNFKIEFIVTGATPEPKKIIIDKKDTYSSWGWPWSDIDHSTYSPAGDVEKLKLTTKALSASSEIENLELVIDSKTVGCK